MQIRIGTGIDFHQFAEGRKFFLGGVEIPFHKGCIGHSDADVLLHAISDALLGALALGDIGKHFPNTDPKYKDIDSKILLRESYALVQEKQYSVINVDATVCLEEPKIARFVPQMREAIAAILNVLPSDISIKATTTETMGFAGRGEGLFAQASVLIMQDVN